MELEETKFRRTEVGLIPEEWDIKYIEEVFKFYPTSNFSKAEMKSEGKVGCLHYGLIHSINNSKFSLENGVKYYVSEEQACYEILKDGDVVMVDASEDYEGINKSVEVNYSNGKNFIAGLHTFLLRDAKGQLADNFRGLILNSRAVKNQMMKLAVGLKVYGVSKNQLKQILLPVPTLTEQKAIATALRDVDELIANLEKLIEKKKAIKQGAMQQLLTPPHKGGKRLEGFSGDWKSDAFSKVCDLIHGHQFLTVDFVNNENGIKVIKIGNVNYNKLILDNCDYIDNSKFNLYEKYLINEGDVLMSLTGNIGRVVKVRALKERLLQNYRVGKFIPKGLDNDFLSIVLGAPQTTKQLEQLSNQAAQANFGKQDFNKVYLDYPVDIEEQKAIAKIINSINDEIECLGKKLNKNRIVKQGMMQELLTGRTRLI